MKLTRRIGSILLILLSFLSIPSYANLPTGVGDKTLPTLAPMLKNVMPAVVNIVASGEAPVIPQLAKKHNEGANPSDQGGLPFDPSKSLPLLSREFTSIGSGVIVDAKKGYILTNAHVVHDANSIVVTLSDRRRMDAKLIGSDVPSDVAVLQVKAEHLTALPLGNSEKLNVGDFVVAIGNPFGLNHAGSAQSVTSGIISGLQRSKLGVGGSADYEDFIQTDAAINPGNSGGALVDLKGKLIGINTAILTTGRNPGNIGIGFAIPSNMADSVMQQLIKYGKVRRGLLGVIAQNLTPELATAFGQPGQNGAIVTQVTPLSPAAEKGLQVGDIITQIGTKSIQSAADVRNTVGLMRVGSHIPIKLIRNHKKIDLNVVSVDPKEHHKKVIDKNHFLYGLAMQDVDQEHPIQGHIKGIGVVAIAKDSPAFHAGLQPGDIIVTANQKPVATMQVLKTVAANSKQQMLLQVMRQGGGIFLVLK